MQNFSLLQIGFYFSKCTYICWILCCFKLLTWLKRALSSKKNNQKFSLPQYFFSPEGLIALSLFETVRLNRDNVTWDINESFEQKDHHTLCWEALLQMLVKHFINYIGQVWQRLITSYKNFNFRLQMTYHMLTDDHSEFWMLINCFW